MKVSRTVHNAAGRPERISEILSIEIKPGWKKGTKITFPEKGIEHGLSDVMHCGLPAQESLICCV